MRPWARLAEIAISWLWIALFVASCLDLNQEPFPLAVPLAIPALVSISKLLYLRRPEIKALFVSGGEPSQSRLQWRLSVTAGVVVFAALAALYFAPNIRTAMSRSHERTAKSEMRSVSAAVEKYAADHNGYPAGDSIQALKGLLEPKYIRTLPQRDPWTTEYRYARRVNANGTVSYRLMSAGRDGQWEENDVWKYVPGETASFDSDIVLEDGVFIRYRGGM
jgi:Tfp pilus assembly protein PilE